MIRRCTVMTEQGHSIATECRIANDFLSRFFGLMGKRSLSPQQAMLFPTCNSIHTFFMRFPIDVVMLGDQGKIVRIVESFRPWRVLLPVRDAKHTLELPSGAAAKHRLQVGQRVNWGGTTL